jgi:hypothetical protein
MREWTLCADLKVYARRQSPAKPATRPDPQTLVDHEVTDRRVMIDSAGGARGADVDRLAFTEPAVTNRPRHPDFPEPESIKDPAADLRR